MKITISGKIGSGKSTIGKILAKKLSLKHYSTGEFMRQIAKDRGISLLELSKIAEKSDEIDKLLDQRQISIGQTQDDFLIDARLGFYFIPDSIKVFLDVTTKEASKRIYSEKRADENNQSFEDTLKNIKKRQESERKRYENYYGIDFTKKSNYDIWIDTTNKTIEQVVELVFTEIDQIKKI
ncbi:MAG TPA: cytidylate kinase family protein [Candidatus Woesearchaeota archaeon]|nr:cytidylate kinase family protein [Candidatus Woesearchaeota archaeon]